MIVGRHTENLNLRIKCEFDYLLAKYPTIAFNAQDWNGKLYRRENGKNILLCTESISTTPKNYDIGHIKQYDAIITYSTKFKEAHPELKVYNTQCPANWENYHWLEDFKGYDNKIRGVCSLQTVYKWGHPFEANHMKHEIMAGLITEPHLLLHTFGPNEFGKKGSYQGNLGYKHSNYHNLKKINEYMFCFAAECVDDPFWSHNYLTERVFNTFKSKTVLVYYGACNVEELLPEHIFVNVRKFTDMRQLSQYLIDLSHDKERYTEMVEEAYHWNLKTTLGDIRYQEEVWKQVIKENPL